MVIAHIFWGLILIALGVISLKFNYQIVGFTGRQDWIEARLGGGSTYLAFKLFSVFLVVMGLMYASGLGATVLDWTLTPLRQAFGSN